MALWQKVKQLDSNDVKEILQVYFNNNIPIELRDICAVWIEGSEQHTSAEKFCTGLRNQINEKLSSSFDLGLPIYVRMRLVDFQISLNTSNAAVLHNIFTRFKTCLESERFFVNRKEGLSNQVSSTALPNCNYGRSPSSVTTSAYSPITGAQEGTVLLPPTNVPFQSSQPQTEEATEIYDPRIFLNNPMRIMVDEEISRIFVAVSRLEELNNNFTIKCHEVKRLQALRDLPSGNGSQLNGLPISPQSPEELRSRINEIGKEITDSAIQMYVTIVDVRNRSLTVTKTMGQLETDLETNISSWTLQQKLNANGKPVTMSIKRLQNMAEYLMEVAWKLRGSLVTADKVRLAHQSMMAHVATKNGVIVNSPDIPEQIGTITSFIKRLVQNTFVITEQPCQVLKTNTRFHILPGKSPMEISLFVGDKLGLQISPPNVEVCIIDEAACKNIQLNGLQGESFKQVIKRGRLFPDTARLDLSEEMNCLTATFRQISLRNFYRDARSGPMGRDQSSLVTEEKFVLLFRSEFSVGDIAFQIWRLSLPIVITTHVSQDSLAWAVVTWDNAFSAVNRIPFQLPDYVSWEGVSDLLNGRFTTIVGAPLTQENIDYFASRFSIRAGCSVQLTWHDVCKKLVPGRKFTFWEWFFEGARFIEQHLKDAWKDGHVKGFIGKETSEEMLCNSGCLPGTFLLRFSESTLGGISIVWLHSNGSSYSLAPFKSKDLASQPLIQKFNQETLHYVYPNVKKEEAFKKYYEEYELVKSDDSIGGRYVRTKTKVEIDNPSIPKFSLPGSNTMEHGRIQNESMSGSQQGDSTYGNITSPLDDIDIDLEQLLNFVEDSPNTWHQGSSSEEYSPANSGICEASSNGSVQLEEETIYFQL